MIHRHDIAYECARVLFNALPKKRFCHGAASSHAECRSNFREECFDDTEPPEWIRMRFDPARLPA